MKGIKIKIGVAFLILAALYLVLLIPDRKSNPASLKSNQSFSWNRNQLWDSLENVFIQAKSYNRFSIDSSIHVLFEKEEKLFSEFEKSNQLQSLDTILNNYFSLAALIAVNPAQRDSFISFYSKVRNKIKDRSINWDVNRKVVRNTIYQALYGMRAAMEEVLLLTDSVKFPNVLIGNCEKSVTPFTSVLGITVHSGDLLVSRGGAQVSALISRGNDYPGNFSHVALVYIDEKGIPFLVEAHIEKGVVIASVDQYEKDTKLRFMVLRVRNELPALQNDKMLPARAAKIAYTGALQRHIPYDFKMNLSDSSAMFCSEVASYAYKKAGIELWQGKSTISSPGVANWLHAFGVDHFITQMPSDLEYDPQLSVVAEWRDANTLYKDHIDNAVMDVLLEEADKGKSISYPVLKLPFVRLVKAWCMLKNLFGSVGIIPEGMSATQALKNQRFVSMHKNLLAASLIRIEEFRNKNKYRPPYWQLVKLCREAYRKY